MASQHDRMCYRLARMFKTQCQREGVDLKTKDRAIEVATSITDLYQSVGQLRHSRKPKKYMAVPPSLIPNAQRLLEDSGIGIMDEKGRIRKKARRK